MGLSEDIQAILSVDAALIAIFSTRILTYEQLGDLGLNRAAFPSAFDTSTGEILPTLIVRERAANNTYAMRGEQEQLASYMQAVEIVGYVSRLDNANDTVLDTALQRVYVLLHDRNAGTVRLMERNRINGQRESMLNFAWMGWSIYDGMGLRKP